MTIAKSKKFMGSLRLFIGSHTKDVRNLPTGLFKRQADSADFMQYTGKY